MFAHVHSVAVVAIIQHTLGYGGWRVLSVGKNSNLGSTLYQSLVKFGPRTASERHDAHVVIRHY